MSASPPYAYRIGIDLGGTKIEAAALAPDGNLRLRRRIPTPPGYDAALTAITDLVRGIETELGGVGSVGIGIPGVISPATGLVKNANSIALNGHPFDRDLPRRSAARCGWKTTPIALPFRKPPTAPAPASIACSASSSAPAAAAAS